MSMAEDTRYRADDYPSREPAPQPAADPLSELARLIGQSDPFDSKPRRASLNHDASDVGPAPQWLARTSSGHEQNDGYAEPYGEAHDAYRAPAPQYHTGDYPAEAGYDQHHAPAAPAGYADDRYAAADPQYADTAYDGAPPDYDNRYHVAPPAAEYEGDGYDDEGHLPPRGEGERAFDGGRRRNGLIMVGAVLGLAAIGTAGAFGYRAFTSPSDGAPPVIKADPTPAKTTPAAAADANKPIQDRVVGAAPVQTERIVPREEPPVAQPVAPARPVGALPPVTFPPAGTAPPPAQPQRSATPAAPNEPKRVKTEVIRQLPNGDVTSTTTPTPAPAAPAAKQKGAPMSIGPQAAVTPPPAAPRAGAYSVQLSSQKTESEARDSYRALQAKYPSVLGGREATIRRADLGDKGIYYRVQMPFATFEAATSFCNSLKAVEGNCVVQKN